jgi:hypothetical protein
MTYKTILREWDLRVLFVDKPTIQVIDFKNNIMTKKRDHQKVTPCILMNELFTSSLRHAW